MHPCVHCLLGFETLEIIEFRNREGARTAAVRQGCVPEGSHRPHEARALYPGGRSRAGPREVAARLAGVLSAA